MRPGRILQFVLQWARVAMTSLTRATLTQTVLTTLFAVGSHKGRLASPDTNPRRLTARLQFLISIASGRSTIATATKIVRAMVPKACAVYNLDVEDTAPGKVTATTVNCHLATSSSPDQQCYRPRCDTVLPSNVTCI